MTHADPERLASSVGHGMPVERRETHGSIVLLTTAHAYKLKKPLRFDFADLRSLEARRAACAEEAAVNTAMGNRYVLGHRAVVPDARGGYRLADPGDPAAIDHLVAMRRFDEHDTLAARIAERRLPPGTLRRCGAVIAGAHRAADPAGDAPSAHDLAARNLVGLAEAAAELAPARRIGAVTRFSFAFLDAWAVPLAQRRRDGLVIDGHGDLRAEHLLIADGEDPVLLDRLEHRWMRLVDVADDLSFLRMDLAHLGADALWDDVVIGYAAAGGAPPPDALLAYFATYRALVRAKVGYVRARQTGLPADRADAAAFLALAERFAADARGPLTLLVTGPPASGKSRLATALAAVTNRPVISSDAIRHGVASGYDPAAKAAVYSELGAAASGRTGCIVDATFGAAALRAAFLGAYRGAPLAAVVLHGPAELLAARATRRGRDPHGSEAGPAVATALAAAFTPVDEIAPANVLALDARRDTDDLADAVLAWLDGRIAA